ncbi:MAG: DUF1330 domain-containing protein, partial [Solirubrobacterales bacterium]|nr:DUF1330 domain-containing protein [Solirubrobacterales bacterium]
VAAVEPHGGRYLARRTHLQKLEGDRSPPQISLIIEWPTKTTPTNREPRRISHCLTKRNPTRSTSMIRHSINIG